MSKHHKKKTIKAGKQTAKIVLLNELGEILVLKTPKGKWDFAGGNRDPRDKTIKACARREVREETEYNPIDIDILGAYVIEGKLRHLCFSRVTKGTIILNNEEHIDSKWIKPSKLKDYKLKPKLKKLCRIYNKASQMPVKEPEFRAILKSRPSYLRKLAA